MRAAPAWLGPASVETGLAQPALDRPGPARSRTCAFVYFFLAPLREQENHETIIFYSEFVIIV